jgi:hypothetical protein
MCFTEAFFDAAAFSVAAILFAGTSFYGAFLVSVALSAGFLEVVGFAEGLFTVMADG